MPISEDDWSAIDETVFLNSIPGMAESIRKAAVAGEDAFVSTDEVDW